MSRKNKDQKMEDLSVEQENIAEETEKTAGGEEISAEETQTQEETPAAEEEIVLSPEELIVLEIEKLKAENEELKDQYLRKYADFENFRKRMFREKEDAIKYANSNLLLDLVAIIDDFERAIKSSEESKDFNNFHSGIELIEKQFTSILEKKYGLKRFDSTGEKFDPERHEAMMAEESNEFDEETVLEDFQKGYMLHDRVLRHSKVKVSKVPEKQGDEA